MTTLAKMQPSDNRIAASSPDYVNTLEVATAFIDRLDANDAEGMRRHIDPSGYWWVDTGHDRAAGHFDVDPGDDRPWPLHGRMSLSHKCDLLRNVGERFPGGIRQIVRRSFASDDIAVLEVEGDGMYLGERPYTNRYCFIIRVADGKVASVREYLDTAHSAAVFDGRNLERRTLSPRPLPDEAPTAIGPGSRVALEFLETLSAADGEHLLAMCTSDATWWHDGGRTRTDGPEGAPDPGPDIGVAGRALLEHKAPRVSKLNQRFPDGLKVQAHRITEDASTDSGLVAIEAFGHGVTTATVSYQNRYAFVIRLQDGLICDVREYCDTRHAFDVFGIVR